MKTTTYCSQQKHRARHIASHHLQIYYTYFRTSSSCHLLWLIDRIIFPDVAYCEIFVLREVSNYRQICFLRTQIVTL